MSKLAKDMKTVAAAGKLKLTPKLDPGINALRRILQALRWDDQGGYPGYCGGGKWDFVSTGLPQTTPEELNALFALAGISPDVIKSKGYCEDCEHAKPCERQAADGSGTFISYHNRGYGNPCCGCQMPIASNFVKRKRTPKNRRYWCTWCGNLFETEAEREEHQALRSKKPFAGHCPKTGLTVLP